MFMPSERHWKEMKYEPAGFWPVPINSGNEFALLLKVSTNVIKSALRYAPIVLSVASAATPLGNIVATVLCISDDKDAPVGVSGVIRHPEEHLALQEVLRTGEAPFIFFDELGRPVARAHCRLELDLARAALTMLKGMTDWYSGPWCPTLAEVLDDVDAAHDPILATRHKYAPSIFRIPMTLSKFEANKITVIGNHETKNFSIEDADEGHGLEQTTWHLLENLFQESICHSPKVLDSTGERELTDVLCWCKVGRCLMESKAMGILSADSTRSTKRRGKSLQKQIDKGIAQLSGAMRMLTRCPTLSTASGRTFKLPEESAKLQVGVVMVSELLPSVDWADIALRLVVAASKIGAPFVVLDLQELRMLVGVSKTSDHLIAHLWRRFEIMCEKKSALIRTKLDGPPLP